MPVEPWLASELVTRKGLDELIEIDSAGTHGYHIGEPPDERACRTMAGHGIDIEGLAGRQVTAADLRDFDYVLAMDRDNLAHLEALGGCPQASVRLFLDFARNTRVREVPDPYYGGPEGFERVYALLEEAAQGLLADIEPRLARA
ncbi:low molecular weight protein-tyrosine-phosphatase [Acidiferrobacter sp. SPIII_3]|uniref:low molecular weight protein-tyrosine-phosphatase n=1 Tax=Acidiferrobacter sp. SPIII_3 TaxID=1281578 RepID=UPI001F0BC734|nr:low molecular weight protein-tyrosine-phosphatase [Acidiferrobacter sp. SPIII_3]